MKFETFKDLTDLMVKHQKTVSCCYKLNIDLIDFCDTQSRIINALWNEILTADGKDWFDWFMYEKNYIDDGIGREDLTANDNGEPICETLEGLYEYLTKNNYFKIKKQ